MSQREVATVLGVDEGTIRNDLRAEKSAMSPDLSEETNKPDAENSAPASISPERDEAKEREQALKQERQVRASNYRFLFELDR